MCDFRGTLSVTMFVQHGERVKKVRLHSWPCVEFEECEELLAQFFLANSHLGGRRQCQAHWVVEERIDIPKV